MPSSCNPVFVGENIYLDNVVHSIFIDAFLCLITCSKVAAMLIANHACMYAKQHVPGFNEVTTRGVCIHTIHIKTDVTNRFVTCLLDLQARRTGLGS